MESRTVLKLVSVVVVAVALFALPSAAPAATQVGPADRPVTPAMSTSIPSWSAHVMGRGEDESANCVFFLDAAEGWAGGSKGRMYHTTDGGLTWKRSYLPNRKLWVKQVQFVSRLRGWALADGWYTKGGYGYDDFRLYRTTDGGVTWKRLWTRRAMRIEEFQFLDAKRGWFAATSKVFTSSNGGKTLSERHADKKIPSLKSAHLNGLRFVDAKHGWVSGGYIGGSKKSIMLRTRDGGRTWKLVRSGLTGSTEDVWFVNRSTGYAVGKGLFKTTNAGGRWRRVRYSRKERYNAVQAFGATDVRMMGSSRAGSTVYSERIWTSRNGGSSWRSDAPKVSGAVATSWSAMSFIDGDTGWVVGQIMRDGPSEGYEYCVLKTPSSP